MGESLFYYALGLTVTAGGGKEWGARYIMDSEKWGMKPYLDDSVKNALRYLCDKMENQDTDEVLLERYNFCEYMGLHQYNDVLAALLDQNSKDKEVVQLCFRCVLASCRYPPNTGMFRANKIFLAKAREEKPPGEYNQRLIELLV